ARAVTLRESPPSFSPEPSVCSASAQLTTPRAVLPAELRTKSPRFAATARLRSDAVLVHARCACESGAVFASRTLHRTSNREKLSHLAYVARLLCRHALVRGGRPTRASRNWLAIGFCYFCISRHQANDLVRRCVAH